MRKTILLSFVYLVSPFCCVSQEIYQKSIDSILNANLSIDKKVMGLLRKSAKLRYTDDSHVYIDEAMQLAASVDDKLLLANVYYSLGNYNYYNSKLDASLESLQQAESYLGNFNNPMLHSSIKMTLGGVKSKNGDVIEAIDLHLEARRLLEAVDTTSLVKEDKRKRTGRLLVSSNALANLYLKIDDYKQALKYYDIGFNTAVHQLKDQANSAIILSNKGELLYKMKRYNESLLVSKKAKQLKIEAQLPMRFITMSEYHIGKAYAANDSLELALNQFNIVIKQAITQKSEHLNMVALAERGFIFLKQQKLEAARKDCSLSKKIAFNIQDSETKIRSCDCLYQVEQELGHYKASLINYKSYSQLKDSIFNEKNIRKTTQLGLQYEFDKKQAQKQLLLDKKNRQRNLAYMGIGILGVFALLLFFFFRKRLHYQRNLAAQEKARLQQANKITAMNSMIAGQEQERTRIAQDLHDSLGGLLSSVKSYFQASQSQDIKNEKVTKTTTLIDQAASEVRRISHNMMPHALTIAGLKDAIADIAERLESEKYEVTLEVNELPKLDPTQEIMIYRLVQELINNIKKHAQASTVFIQLYTHENMIQLTVEDDGKGFELAQAKVKKGLGLESIESRVAYLNGRILWDSQPGIGTTVNINFAA